MERGEGRNIENATRGVTSASVIEVGVWEEGKGWSKLWKQSM